MKPKRIISLLLAICLVAGLMPTAALAAEGDKTIMLGTSGISGWDSTNGYDYIYFGNWTAPDGYTTSGPIKWRVLDEQTNTQNEGLFLLSDVLLGTGTDGDVYFDNSGRGSNVWQNSTAQTWCKNFYSNNFSSKEQNAVLATTKSDSAYTSTYSSYEYGVSSLSGDKVFFLSAEEADNSAYGFTDDNARIANYGNSAGHWWLRSPDVDFTYIAGRVYNYGIVFYSGVYNGWAARPAFNLDLTSVLFTSAAVGGKSASGMDSGLTAVDDYTGSEWKLTLLDNSRNFVVTEEAASGKPGDTITLNYTGTTTGTNEYISVILADENGAQYYGRVAQPTDTDGTVEITIPSGLADGTYTLYVFSEQYNGGEQDDTKLTDYASAFETVALTVSSDTTAPTLTPGSATRDSETAATVKFTSDEAGEYYYAVVESGAEEPSIDTTGTGTACDTTEQTISPTNLSGAGAKDIYIVAKDAAGNVSQQLKITIPAYIAPSYGISASPAALDFGSKTAGYTEAPAAQTVTLTNTGNQNVTVDLPTSTNYIITAGEGFTNDTATLAPNGTAAFTVQPKTGLGAGDYSETLTISGSDGTSANVQLSFTVAFATESDKAIMLGTSGISDPTSTQNSSGTHYTPSDYVYFGVKGSDPIKWRVLDADKTNDGTTSGMFLLSEYLLDSGVVFESAWNSDDNDGQTNPNEWQHSDAQNWCSTFATNSDVFSMAEQAAFLGVTKTDNSEGSLYSSGWGTSSLTENDKVFFLSVRELADYVGNYDKAPGLCATDTAQSAGVWWLRSPYANYTYSAGLVARNGLVSLDFVYSDWAARPAFNLNLNSVLFTSAAVGGKTDSTVDGNLTSVADYTGSEWKLTLLDSSRESFTVSNATTNSSGDTIAFSYSGAQTGTNEYISVIIEDNGAITHYGRILQPGSASGTASFTIPDGVTLSDTVKLYVFNEQYNSDKMTDYASQLKEISSSTDDTTDPTLSNGSATRDSETSATVKFTSSEAGSYYYVVNDSIAAPDSIDTSGEGASCNANEETTITLDSLSGEYIHIVVKDADNNVSDILTIQIPAYTFTFTVNVDPSEGGTASADPSAAVEGDEIELTASPNEGYHFKEWQVTPDTVSIGTDNKFTMPAEDVTVKAVFEAHSFTQENTDSEYLASSATCTQAATYYYSCSCGAKDTNNTFTSGEALGHTLGADWKYNDSNHWKECEDCGAKVDEAAHVYTDDADTTCNDCGYERTIEGGDEPEPGHTADGSGWHRDENGHWQLCACGEHLDAAAHTFAWVTDKPATAAEAGSRHEQCTVCGYRKAAESIPPLAPEPDRGTDEHPEIGDAIADGTWGKTESAPADGETNTEKTVPATGDSSQPVLWIGLLAASGLGIAALLVLRRRKRQ